MASEPITDWDDAYSNSTHIENGSAYPEKWKEAAQSFREHAATAHRLRQDVAYGGHERNRFDLFLPDGAPRGLVVFVHGGYWMALDKSSWSHLAKGPLAHGFAVAMPSYVLCPEARIGEITRQIGAAVSAAAEEISGPIHLAGHSAGGHLVSRLISASTPLSPQVQSRIRKTVSISGLHDLRPLMKTRMNDTLRLDAAEAQLESPALLEPPGGADITCWVGSHERPEFVRQNRLLEEPWGNAGARVSVVEEPGRHHFDVIDGLADPGHRLVQSLLML